MTDVSVKGDFFHLLIYRSMIYHAVLLFQSCHHPLEHFFLVLGGHVARTVCRVSIKYNKELKELPAICSESDLSL